MVEKEDVNEAMRLMEMSKQSLYDDERGTRSGLSAIFSCYLLSGVYMYKGTIYWGGAERFKNDGD